MKSIASDCEQLSGTYMIDGRRYAIYCHPTVSGDEIPDIFKNIRILDAQGDFKGSPSVKVHVWVDVSTDESSDPDTTMDMHMLLTLSDRAGRIREGTAWRTWFPFQTHPARIERFINGGASDLL